MLPHIRYNSHANYYHHAMMFCFIQRRYCDGGRSTTPVNSLVSVLVLLQMGVRKCVQKCTLVCDCM